jgi:hypothetical protein
VARLKFLIVIKFASMNFCSSLMLVILITVSYILNNSCKRSFTIKVSNQLKLTQHRLFRIL